MIIGIIILCMGCVVLALYKHLTYFRTVYQKKVYNSLVVRLSKLTAGLGRQRSLLFLATDKTLLEYFGEYLKAIKTTIQLVEDLYQHPQLANVRKAKSYVDECCCRSKKIEATFVGLQQGKAIHYGNLLKPRDSFYRKSCFFCSQPIFNSISAKTPIIAEGRPLKVLGCFGCKNTLRLTKKINILFFVQNGKRVHWSQSEDYIPSVEYWNMNLIEVK